MSIERLEEVSSRASVQNGLTVELHDQRYAENLGSHARLSTPLWLDEQRPGLLLLATWFRGFDGCLQGFALEWLKQEDSLSRATSMNLRFISCQATCVGRILRYNLPTMISRSDDYVEYCRETAKHARELHDLALRGRDQKKTTELVNKHIVEAVGLTANDDLVEVGCGDGMLLRMARNLGVRTALGILPTEEEVSLVARTGVSVKQGFSHQLPVPDAIASVVVCNCVLLVVPRENIPASLRELARVAKTNARVFIGEIPFSQPKDPTPNFSSRRELLSHLYQKHGLRTWFGMVRRMIWWHLTGQPEVINAGTAVSFFAPPEELIALAEAAGLKLVRYWRHDDPDTRNNYLFCRP